MFSHYLRPPATGQLRLLGVVGGQQVGEPLREQFQLLQRHGFDVGEREGTAIPAGEVDLNDTEVVISLDQSLASD
jgi:hypothetical protein